MAELEEDSASCAEHTDLSTFSAKVCEEMRTIART